MYGLASGRALQAVLLTMVAIISAVAAYAARARRPNDTASEPIIGHIERWRIVRTLSVILFALIFVMATVIYIQDLDTNRGTLTQLILVGVFSGAVGFAELLSRHRDDPKRLLTADPTVIYVTVNVIAGIAALALVKEFEVYGNAGTPKPHRLVYEALLASFGAIAFFRTSFFTARIGNADIGIGPSTLLKSLLDASDLMVDREQALGRADQVREVMKDIDFDKAKVALPVLCFSLVQGVTEEQQKLVAEQVRKLVDDVSMEPSVKATILGVYLIRQVGAPVLERAVTVLKDRIVQRPSSLSTTGAHAGAPGVVGT